jgi:hypothetical protein
LPFLSGTLMETIAAPMLLTTAEAPEALVSVYL